MAQSPGRFHTLRETIGPRQQQGQRDQARQVLAAVYSWFIEGFATSDLQEARALLEQLGITTTS